MHSILSCVVNMSIVACAGKSVNALKAISHPFFLNSAAISASENSELCMSMNRSRKGNFGLGLNTGFETGLNTGFYGFGMPVPEAPTVLILEILSQSTLNPK